MLRPEFHLTTFEFLLKAGLLTLAGATLSRHQLATGSGLLTTVPSNQIAIVSSLKLASVTNDGE